MKEAGHTMARILTLFFIFMAIFALVAVQPVNARTITVCKSGCQYTTIQAAADIVNPGDTVIVGDGVYPITKTVKIAKSGTKNNWITFRSENKWGAVLDGQKKAETGLDLRANYVRIENFEIKNVQDTAVNLHNSNNVYVYGNYIHHIARHCDQSADGSAGLLVGDTHNITLDGNLLDTIGRYHEGENGCKNINHYWQNHDHGFYINRSRDFTIINNVFIRVRSGWPLSVNRGTDRTLISNNTFAFANPNRQGYILLYGGGNGDGNNEEVIIQNNIFYRPTEVPIRAAYPQKDHLVRNNLIIGASKLLSFDRASASAFTTVNNIFVNDPLFFDVNKDDFHLKNENSPAVNAGTGSFPYFFSFNPSPHLLDHDGNQRPQDGAYDIGAYEYVGSGPLPLHASLSASPSTGRAPLTVAFTVGVSGGAAPYSYAWDFGDKTSSTEPNPSHIFESVGSYTVRLTITDGEGQIATASGAIKALDEVLAPQEGLIAWWPLDEGSGTVAGDAAGYGNTGRIHGADWVSYKNATVLSFEEDSDYVEVPLDGMRPETGTVSLWAYPTASSDRVHCLFYHTTQPPWGNRIQLELVPDTGSLALGLGDKHQLRKDIAPLPLQRWAHIVLTWDQGAYRVYVDGVEAASGSYTGLDRIGAFADIGNNGNPDTRQGAFSGMIDEVRLYDVALGPDEIAALAAQRPDGSSGDIPRPPAGLHLRKVSGD
jgi:hypothetical protein